MSSILRGGATWLCHVMPAVLPLGLGCSQAPVLSAAGVAGPTFGLANAFHYLLPQTHGHTVLPALGNTRHSGRTVPRAVGIPEVEMGRSGPGRLSRGPELAGIPLMGGIPGTLWPRVSQAWSVRIRHSRRQDPKSSSPGRSCWCLSVCPVLLAHSHEGV